VNSTCDGPPGPANGQVIWLEARLRAPIQSSVVNAERDEDNPCISAYLGLAKRLEQCQPTSNIDHPPTSKFDQGRSVGLGCFRFRVFIWCRIQARSAAL